MSAKFVFRRLFVLSAIVFAFAVISVWKIASVSEAGKASAMFVPTISATKTDAISTDADGDGRADPGDTLKYTVTVTNSGTDASNVIFQDILSSNLTLVGGSVDTTPLAANDAYNVYGNVAITIPDGATDLLANDIDPDTGNNSGLTAIAQTVSSANCAGCNNVVISADGGFTYDPPAGFTGTDTFTYTSGSGTDTATVTLTVAGMIWFIDPNAAACTTLTLASQCGKFSKPFSSLDTFRAVNDNAAGNINTPAHPGNNQDIFIYQSAASNTLTATLTLLTGQRLIGQDTVPNTTVINNSALFNLTLPTGSATLPSTDTGNPAVTITGFGLTSANNNTIRGLTVTNTGSNTKLSGTGFGTLTLGDIALSGTGRALNLATGTLAIPATATASFTSIASTSSGTQGVNLAGIGGALTVSGSTSVSGATTQGILIGTTTGNLSFGNTTVTGGTDGVSFQNNSAGTRTFGTLTVSGGSGSAFLHGAGGGNVTVTGAANLASTGNPIDIQNAANGTNISFAATTVNKTTAGGAGVNWSGTNTGATLGFASLALTTSNGAGLTASGGGTINVTTGTIAATGSAGQSAPAISANGVTFGATFTGVSSTNSGNSGNGVSLTNVLGNLTMNGGAISGAAGDAFLVSGGTANITYNGTISASTARPVNVSGKTGGTVAFGGAVSSTSNGISLTTNTGATINFTGGLNLSTGANVAFTATGGGTVSATQNNSTIINTLTTTTGTALNVTSTTIGASGITFRSINTSTSSANTGIVLSATGSSGGLTVTGNGGAGTGGTIANKTGADGATNNGVGIYLNDTQNPSFSWMQLNDFQNYAILGATVRGFTLSDSVISGTNGTNENVDEGSVRFTQLTGSALVKNTTIGGQREDGFVVINTSGSLNRITFDNDTFNLSPSAVNDNGLFLQAQSTALMNVTIKDSDFNGARGDQFQFDLAATATGNPTGDLIMTNNNFINGSGATVGGGGVTLSGGGLNPSNVTMTYDVEGNTFRGANGDEILVALQNGQGTFTGKIKSNIFGLAGTDKSGSSAASDIEVRTVGGGTQNVTIDSNQIRQYSNFGILLQAGNAANGGSGAYNATVSNNIISNPSTFGFIKNGIQLNGGTNAGDAHQFCLDILNNTTGGSGDNGGPDIQVRQRFSTTVRLAGYGGANNDNTAVKNYLEGRNTGAEVALASNSVSTGGGGFINGAAGCGTPIALNNDLRDSNRDSIAQLDSSTLPSIFALPAEEGATKTTGNFHGNLSFLNTSYQSPSEMLASIEPFVKHSADAETVASNETLAKNEAATAAVETISAETTVEANETVSMSESAETQDTSYSSTVAAFINKASNAIGELADKLGNSISPTVIAQELRRETGKKQTGGDLQTAAPEAVGTVCVDGNTNSATCAGGFTLPAGKSVTITFNTIISANPPLPAPALTSVSNQGSVSGTGFTTVQTDDPDFAGTQATVTTIDSTTVSVASNANPSVFGQSVTLTATLTGAPAHASGNPSGTVQFKDGATNIGSPVAVVAGATNTATAQVSVSNLTVGNHTITAEYSGGGGFNANVGTLTGNPQVVNKANTTTGLTASQNPSVAAQTVTFTATVAAVAPGAGVPSGTVQFLDGGNPIAGCTSVALASAQAQCSTNTLAIGNRTITAQYGGDGNFNTSNVGLTGNPQVVNKAATVYVDDGFAGSSDAQDLGGGKLFNRNAFATITNGLANVATGGTVNVEDGTYAESINLNQSATIVGTGSITLTGGLTITTGVWTSTGGVFSITGNFTRNGGTFNHNGGTFVLNGTAAQTIGGTTSTAFNNLTVSNAAGASFGIDTTIGGALTLTNGILGTGTTTLTLTPTATSVRDGGCAITTCFVTSGTGGGLKKQFSGAPTASFIFHVGTTGGTDNGWSPVTLANATPSGTGDLMVRTVDAASPAAISTPKISRYWALTGANLTANISFTYLDGDLTGTNETKLRVFKETVNQCASDCVDDATNTGTVANVNSFSNWTFAEALGSTAAEATISGRVVNASGRGIGKVRVMLSGGNLSETRYAMTDYFGNYRFADVSIGQDYVITPMSSRYRFTPNARVQSLTEDSADVNFIANLPTP